MSAGVCCGPSSADRRRSVALAPQIRPVAAEATPSSAAGEGDSARARPVYLSGGIGVGRSSGGARLLQLRAGRRGLHDGPVSLRGEPSPLLIDRADVRPHVSDTSCECTVDA